MSIVSKLAATRNKAVTQLRRAVAARIMAASIMAEAVAAPLAMLRRVAAVQKIKLRHPVEAVAAVTKAEKEMTRISNKEM